MISSLWPVAMLVLIAEAPPRKRLLVQDARSKVGALFAAAFAVIVLTQGPGLILGITMIFGFSFWKVRRSRMQRNRRAAAHSTATLLHSVASDLSSGATARESMEHLLVNPPEELRETCLVAAHRARSGISPATALLEAPPEFADLRKAARLWLAAEAKGVPVAALLSHMASRVEAEQRHARATDAALQGPRATALILMLLPVFGIGLGTAMGADPLGFLTGTALGGVLLVLGIGLAVAGSMWVDLIVSRAQGEQGAVS